MNILKLWSALKSRFCFNCTHEKIPKWKSIHICVKIRTHHGFSPLVALNQARQSPLSLIWFRYQPMAAEPQASIPPIETIWVGPKLKLWFLGALCFTTLILQKLWMWACKKGASFNHEFWPREKARHQPTGQRVHGTTGNRDNRTTGQRHKTTKPARGIQETSSNRITKSRKEDDRDKGPQ